MVASITCARKTRTLAPRLPGLSMRERVTMLRPGRSVVAGAILAALLSSLCLTVVTQLWDQPLHVPFQYAHVAGGRRAGRHARHDAHQEHPRDGLVQHEPRAERAVRAALGRVADGRRPPRLHDQEGDRRHHRRRAAHAQPVLAADVPARRARRVPGAARRCAVRGRRRSWARCCSRSRRTTSATAPRTRTSRSTSAYP